MPKFKTKARIIDLLGKNQIADLPTAVSELWKNGYDAYGDRFYADLYCPGFKDVSDYAFMIKDDGHGMSYDDLISKWIVLGTDSKKKTSNYISEAEMLGKELRIPLGEKGIGRLSSAFLGSHMLLITKKKNEDIQLLFINWLVTENYEEFLENIDIPIASIQNLNDIQNTYEELYTNFKSNLELKSWGVDINLISLNQTIQNELIKHSKIPIAIINDINDWFNSYEHGTVFLVFNPIEELVNLARYNGLTEKNKESSAASYFYSTLSGLFNPFDDRFETYKDINSELGTKFILHKDDRSLNLLRSKEFFTKDDLDNCEHWIKGNFDEFGCFDGKIKVNDEEISYTWKPERLLEKTNYGNIEIQLAFLEGLATLSLLSKEEYEYYQNKFKNYSGLFIYRDGFRVLPYGKIEADFLEFEKRRSMRAGTYYFSHRKMFGYLGITKQGNSSLIDKAGREGLTNNKAFKELKRDLTEFFIVLAKEYYGTDSKMKTTRDKRKGERKKEKEREKKEREEKRRLEEEQKKLKKELMQYRELLRLNLEKVRIIKTDLGDFEDEIKSIIRTGLIDGIEKINLFNKYEKYKEKVDAIEISFPTHLIFKERDIELYDIYYSDYIYVVNLLEQIYNMILFNCSGRLLGEEYNSKLTKIAIRITKDKQECMKTISNKFDNIKDVTYKRFNKFEQEILIFKNDNIDFKSSSEKDLQTTIISLNKLIKKYDNEVRLIKEESDFYAGLRYDKNEIELLKVYKREYGELEYKVKEMHELAQLGISIELIDHQFNALYGNISESLSYLQKRVNTDTIDQFNSLKVSFEHLERNHKMLVPMFRTMRRHRKIISGKSIYEFVKQFYGDVFKKDKIDITATKSFLQYTYNSFESVIMPVFINVVNNAIYWLSSSKVKKIVFTTNKLNEVKIMNSGKEMSETELTKCFELFYSKKPSGRGMGLYLAKINLNTVGLNIYATNDWC